MSNENSNVPKSNYPGKDFLNIDDIKIPQGENLITAILELKGEKNAMVLVNENASQEIKSVADIIASRENQILETRNTQADIFICEDKNIAFFVKFLNPNKKVIYLENENLDQIFLCLKYELPQMIENEDWKERALETVKRMLS